MATAALGTSDTSDGVLARKSVLEIAPASAGQQTVKIKETPHMFINLDLVFKVLVHSTLLSFHSDTFAGNTGSFFLNTYNKIMQVK